MWDVIHDIYLDFKTFWHNHYDFYVKVDKLRAQSVFGVVVLVCENGVYKLTNIGSDDFLITSLYVKKYEGSITTSQLLKTGEQIVLPNATIQSEFVVIGFSLCNTCIEHVFYLNAQYPPVINPFVNIKDFVFTKGSLIELGWAGGDLFEESNQHFHRVIVSEEMSVLLLYKLNSMGFTLRQSEPRTLGYSY